MAWLRQAFPQRFQVSQSTSGCRQSCAHPGLVLVGHCSTGEADDDVRQPEEDRFRSRSINECFAQNWADVFVLVDAEHAPLDWLMMGIVENRVPLGDSPSITVGCSCHRLTVLRTICGLTKINSGWPVR